MKRSLRILLVSMVAMLFLPVHPAWAQDEDISHEYRLTLFPYHRLTDKATAFEYLGYVTNPDKDYQTYYLGFPGANYSLNRVAQLWGGVFYTYTDNASAADKLEVRPFVGVKLFLPNRLKWHIYDFTRFEFRQIQDRNTRDWSSINRLRNRLGVEVPLTSREKAWQPKTWYALADAELFYRFDRDVIDPLRLRGGIAYIVNGRFTVEAIYHGQYTRPAGSSSLQYTDNIFRLNIKIGLSRGVLDPFFSPDADD